MRTWKVALIALGVTLFMAGSAFAQGRGNRGGGQGGAGGPGGGNFDPTAMRQRFMDRFKEQLGVTDDEWKVILPKLEKVMTAQSDTRGGGFGGMGGRGGRGGRGGGDTAAQSEMAKASAELRTVLENKNASAEEIATKLKAYRDARDKAQTALETAQKELKELLTARQEAILVRDGMLK